MVVLFALALFVETGRAEEEHAPPLPPWAEKFQEPEPARERSHHWHFFELREDSERGPTVWLRPEYILSWIHSSRLPPLVTTGLATDSRPGALGNPFTKISYGNEPLDYQDRHGFRIAIGGTVSEDHALSVEASYLTLDGRTQSFQGFSPGSPIVARPFFDVVNNAQDSSLTTYPGFLAGTIHVSSTSYLQTEELNAFAGLW